jgi:hypothetical protein
MAAVVVVPGRWLLPSVHGLQQHNGQHAIGRDSSSHVEGKAGYVTAESLAGKSVDSTVQGGGSYMNR